MLRHAKRVASSSGPRRAVRPSRHPVRDCGGSPFDVHGVRTPAPWPFAPRRAPSGTNGHGDRRTACRPGQPGGEGPPARAPCAAPPGWRHVRMVARASTAAGRTGTRGDNLDCGGGRRAPLRRQLGGAGICEPAAEPAPRRRSRPGDSIGAPDAYLRGQRADPVPSRPPPSLSCASAGSSFRIASPSSSWAVGSISRNGTAPAARASFWRAGWRLIAMIRSAPIRRAESTPSRSAVRTALPTASTVPQYSWPIGRGRVVVLLTLSGGGRVASRRRAAGRAALRPASVRGGEAVGWPPCVPAADRIVWYAVPRRRYLPCCGAAWSDRSGEGRCGMCS